jgi:DNA repair protein RecO (recombination protein O)
MPQILKTEGIVLSKLDFQESSKIVRIYTKDYGKKSFIVKAARSKRSKTGNVVDPLNHLEVLFYQKDSRDIQMISDVALINFYPHLKNDYESLIYSSAITELIDRLIHEAEPNERLLKGTLRIFELINENVREAKKYFVKYLFFFLEELGYQLQMEKCSSCSAQLEFSPKIGFNYEKGFLCSECINKELINFSFSAEQFKKVRCLSSRSSNCDENDELLEKLIRFFEKYLSYQVDEFREIKSLKLL